MTKLYRRTGRTGGPLNLAIVDGMNVLRQPGQQLSAALQCSAPPAEKNAL